jgi:hypothetical protein
MPRPQFSLKATLVIILLLSLPLGLAATRELTKMAVACLITPPIVGGCSGYVIARRLGVILGVAAGVASVFLALLSLAVWMHFTGEPIYIPAY